MTRFVTDPPGYPEEPNLDFAIRQLSAVQPHEWYQALVNHTPPVKEVWLDAERYGVLLELVVDTETDNVLSALLGVRDSHARFEGKEFDGEEVLKLAQSAWDRYREHKRVESRIIGLEDICGPDQEQD